MLFKVNVKLYSYTVTHYFLDTHSAYLSFSVPTGPLQSRPTLASSNPLMGKSSLQLEQPGKSAEPQAARHQRREGEPVVWGGGRGGRWQRGQRGGRGEQQAAAGALGAAAGFYSLPLHNSRVQRLQRENPDLWPQRELWPQGRLLTWGWHGWWCKLSWVTTFKRSLREVGAFGAMISSRHVSSDFIHTEACWVFYSWARARNFVGFNRIGDKFAEQLKPQ